MRAQTGENVLIGGFILANGSGTKEIVIRALGPSLGARGVAFPLLDPSLQLFDGSGQLIASNDDWMSNANEQDIIDSTLAPTDPRESAILTFLGPGKYTAVVTGVDGTSSNIALVEVYDLDSNNPPNLANISTRASVDTGDGQMIAGLIVGGTTVKSIAIRGLGPSLASAAIASPLPNPTLTVVNGSGVAVAANDNWQTDPSAGSIQAVGLAPTNTLESALVVSLVPGAYTAILSDASGESGVGLVEVYDVTAP